MRVDINMPCMGPDIEFARKQGNKVAEELFADIVKQHKLIDPLEPSETFVLPKADLRWKKIKKQFVKAVEDMFEEDACNGF